MYFRRFCAGWAVKSRAITSWSLSTGRPILSTTLETCPTPKQQVLVKVEKGVSPAPPKSNQMAAEKRNLNNGDVVLLREDQSRQNEWKMGLVTKTNMRTTAMFEASQFVKTNPNTFDLSTS